MSTTVITTEDVAAQRDALTERLFQSMLGIFDIVTIYLGDRLGLYQALEEIGPATSARLAAHTGTHERYVREWLEQQAVTGILEVADNGRDAATRRYRLPPGHVEALLDRDSLSYQPPWIRQMIGAVHPLPALLHAFRNGGGVPYTGFGPDMREGIADGNRTMFINLLGSAWLPAIPDVHARLRADPPARVADIGCGSGWSSIAIARSYPLVHVDGFDVDEPSVALARDNIAAAGLAERVSIHCSDVAGEALTRRYDLVTAFECIHDMPQPVAVLRAMRELVTEGGAVLVADERVAEGFAAPGDDLERLMYGYSVLHCLPVGMAEAPSRGTGTVMRPDMLRRFAAEAGFREVEVLPVEAEFWRFYRLVP